MIKLVIFDLDGTLLNTLEDLANSGNHVLRQHGFPIHSMETYRYFIGNGIPMLVRRMLPPELSDDIYRQCLDEFIAYYEEHKADKTRPYDGISETLTQLQNMGIKVAVATNKIHSAVAPLMKEYFPTILFDSLCGQQSGVKPKPDPQTVFRILKDTGCSAGETLYVGDSAVDMDTAHNAGLRAVGGLWGFRSQEELTAAGATWLIHNPLELLPLVRQINLSV